MRHALPYMLLAAALAACAAPTPESADTSAPASPVVVVRPAQGGLTGDQARDEAAIAALEQQARRLAIADGCSDAGRCATAPVGVKGCGGPRDFLVYCTTATDTAALMRKLDELARAERAYNERYGIGSDCAMQVAPAVTLAGQGCRAAP